MPKIFIHIGLPKTATSTLQMDVFPKINTSKITYLGINEPRENIQNPIFSFFMKSIYSGIEVDYIKHLLAEELKKGKNLLISEEMIVVGDWKQKILNLARIIKDFDYQLIITVREPAEAMFSYYVELYHIFKKEKLTFYDTAIYNDYMKIFYYKCFIQHLLKYFEKDRINIFKFEEIIKGNILGIEKVLSISQNFEIQNNNFRKKTSKYVRRHQDRRITNILSNTLIFRKLIFLLKDSFLKPVLKRLFHLFDFLKIVKRTKINKPSVPELQSLRLILKDETSYLSDEFGIQYLD